MSNLLRASLAPLILALLVAGDALADRTIDIGIPGGDGRELLSDPRNPADRPAGTILLHDEECAKKTPKGERLKDGQPNPEYEKCVKAKLEKAKKKGQPVSH